jgi:hypothetical protein
MRTLLALTMTMICGLAACTESHPPPQTPASGANLETPRACPLGVDGASVTYEPTADGGALVFTAPPEQVADLRQRAQDASAVHGPGEKLGKGHDGKHGSGGDHGLKAMQLPPARVGAIDVEGGARIAFIPADMSDLDVLRVKLQARARELMARCG